MTRSDPIEARKTQFTWYKGEKDFLVVSGKYNLSRYFEPGTKEHKCLRKLFSSFEMSEKPILENAVHLPVLRLKEQVFNLTTAVTDLYSKVSRLELEAEYQRNRSEAQRIREEGQKNRMDHLERRIRELESRDESPIRKTGPQ